MQVLASFVACSVDGYQYTPDESITIQALWTKKQLKISLTDSGKSFDFYNAKEYNVQDAFEEKRNSGFGLHIIRRSVDDIIYRSDPVTGNELILIKYLNGKARGSRPPFPINRDKLSAS